MRYLYKIVFYNGSSKSGFTRKDDLLFYAKQFLGEKVSLGWEWEPRHELGDEQSNLYNTADEIVGKVYRSPLPN